MLLGVGSFVYKELFPEYKTYQYVYKDLEKFRSTYTGEKPAPFSVGIKQILIPDERCGPEIIDRCISCHVAMDLPHFSPVRVAHDVNNNPIFDAEGHPLLEENPDYVWERLDLKVAELRATGYEKEAASLEKLKTGTVDGREVDMTKVIQMHPLIGSETRPFDYHPMEEYGCTSCHSGNGQALVAKRAHGPVYDGEYEPAYEIVKPQFTEKDEENDPPFARMYNSKPGHGLVFQTTPILAGDLLVAKCVQCHQSSSKEVKGAVSKLSYFVDQKKEQIARIQEGIQNDRTALVSLLALTKRIDKMGRDDTIDWLKQALSNYRLTSTEIDALTGQLIFLEQQEEPLVAIHERLIRIVGSEEVAEKLMREALNSDNIPSLAEKYEGGSIGAKHAAYVQEEETLKRFEHASQAIEMTSLDRTLVKKMGTQVDTLIQNYNRGKELFISQACYACHRIAGFSRASVGPELTRAGLSYPWYIKESIVWPQADLPSSTMPNFRLDHQELSDLMTFLMAQTGGTKAVSEVDYQISLNEWEAGAKMPWEKPVAPTAIRNVRDGMHVFVSEGCAACHKLEGFESNTGLAKGNTIEEREWFYRLVPEQILGSRLAEVVKKNGKEIDARIVEGVRKDGIIEEIEAAYPGLVEGFYTNFKFASRQLSPEDQKRLRKVLMVYIQLYGMGRDIAPHLNWSGVYRDEKWLIGHFQNPSAYTARSIMPTMPFDETKFYMLTNMLQELGKKNRDSLHELWTQEGFNPPLAYALLCSSCHGTQRQGNGVISDWIYPIPKNLRNPVFLRNLTKERAIESIAHGVQGSPMPPWGEATPKVGEEPVLTHSEIVQLVDWLYQGLPQEARSLKAEDFEKWSYSPDDVVKEMQKQKNFLQPAPPKGETTLELAHDYFEARPNPIPGPDKELYYIREKYYTDQNLAEAKHYFEMNCATCHGKEGGGTGLRATSMEEAKPRMLTNLPWLNTRDDLRLLRSIKYGVPGTSMIPWGDQTTSAQRMQLVMFIRELTRAQVLSDALQDVLFSVFGENILSIEKARVSEYTQLEKEEKELKSGLERLYQGLDVSAEEYARIQSLQKDVAKQKEIDGYYLRLIALIEEERDLMQSTGEQMIGTAVPDKLVHQFFDLIREEALAFSFEHGELEIQENPESPALKSLIAALDHEIAAYEEKIKNSRSPEMGKAVQSLLEEQGTYINLRTKLVVQLADAKSLSNKEREIYDKLYTNHL